MSTLPKIPLDSSSDLAFLRLQLQQALSTRLQTHLPDAKPEDTFRIAIETHISELLSKTMQSTVQNVTINGMEPRPSDIAKGIQVEAEGYETFDTHLQASVLAKHADLEETITRVTRMRREVPRSIMALVEDNAHAELEEVEREEEAAMDAEMDNQEGVRIPRLEEVMQTYDASVKLMREMKNTVGGVNAKAQRAKEVLTFIQKQQQQAVSSRV